MRFAPLAAVVLAVASLAAPALGASDSDKATARELGQRGADALRARDYAKAHDLFSRANQLYHAPTLSLGLARSLAGLGRLVEAVDVYSALVSEGPGPAPSPAFKKAVDDARGELKAVEPRIAHVVVEVTPAAGAQVKIDGEPIGAASFGIERAINPGKHEATAEAPGMATAREKFELAEGARGHVALTLHPGAGGEVVPAAAPAPAPGPPSSDAAAPVASSSSSARTVGFVLMGVGGAGLVVGGITGGLAMSKRSDLVKQCGGGTSCPGSARSTHDAFTSLATVSTIAFIGGGVVAATGITIVLAAPKRAASPSSLRIETHLGFLSAGLGGEFQ